MDFIMEIFLKNGAYAVMFIGVMAFLVSCITEVLKHITCHMGTGSYERQEPA